MSDEAEREIVYELETCIPKDSYIKPIYGKVSRKYIIPNHILDCLVMAEIAALAILDKSSVRIVWVILLAFFLIIKVLGRIIVHRNEIKQYEKIHAAKEDCVTYTFYNECVKVKGPTIEATLNYETAEFFAENKERLMIIFPFNRGISIQKSQCDEEMLAFFRRIVPGENQKKTEKKTAKKFIVSTALSVLYTVLLAVMIVLRINQNARYYPKYVETTYISFEACLYAGTVDDIIIVDNKYIEYTYTGRGEDERYYTVYSGDDIDLFTEILDGMCVNWKFE